MADRGFNTPPGTSLVTLEPSRTGLSQPLQIHIQDEVEGVQAIHPDTGIFVPRNEVEKTNILNYINTERSKQELKPLTPKVFDYNNNRFIEYNNARFAAAQEGQRRDDPYKFLIDKWRKSGSKEEANTEGGTSMWQKILDPIGTAKSAGAGMKEIIKDVIPRRRSDFIMYGDVLGSMAGFAGTAHPAGKALAVPKSIMQSVFKSPVFKTGTGASLAAGGMSVVYDVLNNLIRKTKGIPNPTDAEDPGMRAMVEMRNSLAFTYGAAGLGTVASALRPVIGKALFGLGQEAKQMANMAELHDVPLGISIVSSGQGAIASGAKKFGKVIGLFPFIGNIMRQRQLMSEARLTKAIERQGTDIGSVDEFYREQYRLMTKDQKKVFMKDLNDQGFKTLDEAIEAEQRINGYAPIQHMTDVGTFMFDAAKARYMKFAYVNDLLYDDFEKKAMKISKPFIATNNTKQVGQYLKDRLDQMRITMSTSDDFIPSVGEIDDFITNTLGNLPEYITPMQLRGLQRQVNHLYSSMRDIAGKPTFSGSGLLADARKALTTDLNNFALWRQDLTDAEKVIAESAKKSLSRANGVFAKMSPLYKSPAAKKFKFVDENMFSPGPDLPGYFYSDELFNIVARKGITPKTIADIEQLVGPAAFNSTVRTWIHNGFKNSLDKVPVDYYETIVNEAGKKVKIPVTQLIMDPDKFMKNIGYGEPGFEAMMGRIGKDGKIVKENIEILANMLRKTQAQEIPFASQLISRRLVLGGVRSMLKTFSFGMATGAGGGVAGGPVGAMTAVAAGLMARFTADFLSSPQAMKNYTRIVDPAVKDVVRKSAYAQLLKNFYEQKVGNRKSEGLEDFPDEFKTYKGAIDNPDGFFKWLFGAGYKAEMDAVNDDAHQQYMERRYGDNIDVGLSTVQDKQMEEKAGDMLMNQATSPNPRKMANRQPATIDVPNVQTGTEDIFEEDVAVQSPINQGGGHPMNQAQRVALAGGNLDEAIALGGRV